MGSTPRKNDSANRLFRAGGAVAALTLGASLLAVPQSFAASSPTPKELLDACSWADLCQFHPQSYQEYTGPRHQVGRTAYNCGSQTNQHRIDWSDTTSSTNSIGVSISVGAKFWNVFESEIETTYRHDWTTSHTDTESDTLNIPAGSKGWIERGTSKQQATGWYEIHFGKRYYGHYIWYINNYKSSGYDVDNSSKGYINFKDTRMTSTEFNQHCR
ncbi:hypothetical protein AB0M32_51640 [Streptomyces sp. NPDC051985]|uniref:hypothetical protein n=1 Tax=Streptomyces sp. NPDC051985 TaxID=3155807 RepID=UPI00341220BD